MQDDLTVLTEYVRNESGYRGPLDPNADLLDARILDSFSIVQLAMFVQEKFGVDLEAEDLTRDNLATLAGILALVEKRKLPPRN